jgi:hypothetical protein
MWEPPSSLDGSSHPFASLIKSRVCVLERTLHAEMPNENSKWMAFFWHLFGKNKLPLAYANGNEK